MQKTAIKAFVFSFSVSLFAIIAANRTFWHQAPSVDEPLNIGNKNIVLFLKNTQPAKSPVKKIALNTLPEISPKAHLTPQFEPEVILASNPEEIDFPIEIAGVNEPLDGPPEEAPVILADVLYSPETPQVLPEIEAEPVYAPDIQPEPKFKAPLLLAENKKPAEPAKTVQSAKIQPPAAKSQEKQLLELARAAETGVIPLQKDGHFANDAVKIEIGNPQDLNHVALNNQNIPIQSMKKAAAEPEAPSEKQKDWQPMSDSPWIVAKSGGGAKNQFSTKGFADKTPKDIQRALETPNRGEGIQVAADTVKNLIIPIPENIMEDKNLTPKLAYPSTSADATKEKLIDAKIKLQEKTAAASSDEKTKLLSPIEEDIALDAPVAQTAEITPITPLKEPTPPAEPTEAAPAKKAEKDNILTALNSIFTSSPKKVADTNAKDKAIARAQAKRSFKKKLAKTRPVSIMPTEIRLSFQPNRAEISGQTLRWVQAFASKAAESPDITLEIRIDGTSATTLQQKRLNLLHNILTNKGVGYSQINTVFTNREPNSFILRTLRPRKNDSGGKNGKTNTVSNGQYIQW